MPDLNFRVLAVEPAARALTPLLHFKLEITNSPATEAIQALILHAQIQIQVPRRSYSPVEKARLSEIFGPPEHWGRTLGNRLWAQTQATSAQFCGRVELILEVPCTFDLNVAATKYFQALEGGEVHLLFLFSGTVFYLGTDGRLQVDRISWSKECEFTMTADLWRELMDRHYPKSAWVWLHKEVFDRLYSYRRQHGITSWEQTVERLLGNESAPVRDALQL